MESRATATHDVEETLVTPRHHSRLSDLAAGAVIAVVIFVIGYDEGAFPSITRDGISVIAWLIMVAAVIAGVWRLRSLTPASGIGAAALGALAVLAGLSFAWAPSPERALDSSARLFLYLAVFLITALGASRIPMARWVDGLAVGVTGLVAVALTSRFFPSSFGGHTVIAVTPETAKRLSYPLGYWNGLAVLAALGVPVLVSAALASRRALLRGVAAAPIPACAAVIYLASSRGGALALAIALLVQMVVVPRRVAFLGVLVVAVPASLATVVALHHWTLLVNSPVHADVAGEGHKAALVTVGVCAATGLLYALIARFVRFRAPERGVETAVLVFALVALVVAVIGAHPVKRFDDFKRLPPTYSSQSYVESHLLSPSGNGRWQLWQTAWNEFRTKPVVGRGAGSYESWQLRHGVLRSFVQDAHSEYMQTLGELGALGLFLFLCFVGSALFGAVRILASRDDRRRMTLAGPIAIFAAFGCAMAFDWVWELPGVAVVGIVAFALVTAGVGRPASARRVTQRVLQRRQRPRRRPTHTIAAVVGVAACCAVIGFEAISALSEVEVNASRSAAAADNYAAALRHALRAQALAPWNATPYTQVAVVAEAAGNYPAAEKWIDSAIAHDSSDWSIWLTAARIETEAGKILLARHRLDHARALNPGL